jgi:protein associated with RNAse G/E
MGDEVRIVYRKYDGALHWNMTMKWLGEDEYGAWTGAGANNTSRRGDGPVLTFEHPQVMLFPRGSWWTASFNAAPARVEIYCDVTTPVSWPTPHEVTMVDLDLDVCRTRDGRIAVLDEDEFAEHQVRYGYPADVIAQSVRAAAWLQVALADGTEPFATVYQNYLALVSPPVIQPQ